MKTAQQLLELLIELEEDYDLNEISLSVCNNGESQAVNDFDDSRLEENTLEFITANA